MSESGISFLASTTMLGVSFRIRRKPAIKVALIRMERESTLLLIKVAFGLPKVYHALKWSGA
jgi:hypothetical protein